MMEVLVRPFPCAPVVLEGLVGRVEDLAVVLGRYRPYLDTFGQWAVLDGLAKVPEHLVEVPEGREPMLLEDLLAWFVPWPGPGCDHLLGGVRVPLGHLAGTPLYH